MGKYNPEIHHRRSIRLKDYDYSQKGVYFVTICTYKGVEMFGEITEDCLHINHRGEIVQSMWDTLPNRFLGIELDAFIVMPNHVHGIIVRTERTIIDRKTSSQKPDVLTGKLETSRKSSYRSQTLYEIVRTFKSVTSYHLHRSGNTPEFQWHREYYDHIIRNAQELDTIRNYIINNPSKWQKDKLHPDSNWRSKQKQ